MRDIVDASGNELDHVVYDSFGGVMGQTNASNGDRFTFAGMQFDTAIGQYYDHARWYGAGQGRFLSIDPKGFPAGDTDLYRYVGNGPTDGTDPSGEILTGNLPWWLLPLIPIRPQTDLPGVIPDFLWPGGPKTPATRPLSTNWHPDLSSGSPEMWKWWRDTWLPKVRRVERLLREQQHRVAEQMRILAEQMMKAMDRALDAANEAQQDEEREMMDMEMDIGTVTPPPIASPPAAPPLMPPPPGGGQTTITVSPGIPVAAPGGPYHIP